MLNRLSINTRILILIIIPAIILGAVGYIAVTTITKDKLLANEIHGNTEIFSYAYKLNTNINKNYTTLLSNINSGFIYWKAANQRTKSAISSIKKVKNTFSTNLQEHWSQEQLSSPELTQLFLSYDRLISSYENIQRIFSKSATKKNKTKLYDYVLKKMYPLSNSLNSHLDSFATNTRSSSLFKEKENIKEIEDRINTLYSIILGGVITALFLGILNMLAISRPTKNLTRIVERLSNGEFDARVKIIGTDELSKLSVAFNNLLDDRENTFKNTEEDHNKLNESVFKLLQAVAELSERNLTIRAEVTEDATGPVADAINQLAEETASTLKQVRDVALQVNRASQTVNSHLLSVNKLAMKEQEQAIETAAQMDKMLQRIDEIANSATKTNLMADNTKASTQRAHESVSGTLNGMAEIRETVQETGQRIKKLGERSQEISHVIDIINTIAERTTVLALNASMQAVAAGDAGRGFSVIAEEIQHLAESSRESTEQIATLVRNIQQETNTTIATMDQTIEHVINGSTRAEDAAQQMKEVLKTTNQLIQSVELIATASREQVGISESLKQKAQSILKSTQSTGQELLSLTGLSRKMSEYAQQLVHSVNVFTIDEKKPDNSNTPST